MTMRPSRTVQSQAAGASGLPSALVRPVTHPSKTTTPPASWILSIRNGDGERGAQREITGWLIAQGYKPDGRWTTEAEDDRIDYGPSETWRRFKLA